MEKALVVSVFVAAILAFGVRISQPGELFYARASYALQWAQMHRPAWLPGKVVGECLFCTVFWWSLLVTVIVVLITGKATVYTLFLPAFIALFTEFFTAYLRK